MWPSPAYCCVHVHREKGLRTEVGQFWPRFVKCNWSLMLWLNKVKWWYQSPGIVSIKWGFGRKCKIINEVLILRLIHLLPEARYEEQQPRSSRWNLTDLTNCWDVGKESFPSRPQEANKLCSPFIVPCGPSHWAPVVWCANQVKVTPFRSWPSLFNLREDLWTFPPLVTGSVT